MIKTVIFDIDNTLYDFDNGNLYGMQAVMRYCQNHFKMEEKKIQEYYFHAWHLAQQRIGTDSAAIHNRMLRFQCMMELLDQPLFPHVRALYHEYWDTLLAHIEPSPGIMQFLHTLKEAQIRIGIGTDMTAYIQYRKLEVLGLSQYIDMMVTSEEAGVEKPHPKFFELCVEKAGCLAKECAFIGDNQEKDVNGAIAGGLCGIWYSQGKKIDQDMPFPVIRSFENSFENSIDYILTLS